MTKAVRSSIFVGLLIAVAAALFISVNNVLTPQIYASGSTPITLLVFRYLGLLVVTGLWVTVAPSVKICTPREFRISLIVGAIYGCAAAALLTSISHLPVSLAILIFYIFPLLTLIAESILDREKPRAVTVIAVLLALLGLAIVLGVKSVVLAPWGILFAVIAAICASSGFIISGRNLRAVQPVVMVYHTAKAGLVVALLLLLVDGQGYQVGASMNFWVLLAGGVITFGIAYGLMFAGVRLIGATRTSMVMNLEPIFTALLSAVILLDALTVTQVLGAVLVVLSVAAAQYWSRPIVSSPVENQ